MSYQINKFSLKTRFDVLQEILTFSLISRMCTLRVRGKQKVSVSFVDILVLPESAAHNYTATDCSVFFFFPHEHNKISHMV